MVAATLPIAPSSTSSCPHIAPLLFLLSLLHLFLILCFTFTILSPLIFPPKPTSKWYIDLTAKVTPRWDRLKILKTLYILVIIVKEYIGINWYWNILLTWPNRNNIWYNVDYHGFALMAMLLCELPLAFPFTFSLLPILLVNGDTPCFLRLYIIFPFLYIFLLQGQ